MRRIVATLLVAVALAGSCGGDDEEKPEASATTEVPLTLPPTTERQVSNSEPDEVDPDEEVEPSSTTESTPATLPVGLPSDLGIPGAGNISLGSGSTISNGFGVRGVDFGEVVFWVIGELQGLGWETRQGASNDAAAIVIQFTGPGAVGQATVAPSSTDIVDVDIVMFGG